MSNKIVIAGAGSVGCFIGGVLANAGHDIVLLGRETIRQELQSNGLHLTSLDGLDLHLDAAEFGFSTNPAVLSEAEIILVTVKSLATAEMSTLIAAHAHPQAIVVSLQNGVSNSKILKAGLKTQSVYAGIIGFNVVHMPKGKFHKGTSGDILITAEAGKLAERLNTPALPVKTATHIEEIQWGKLILNLNNALNALSGIPLKRQMELPQWRKVLATQMSEALMVLKANRIVAKPINKIPLRLIPPILRLPNPLFGMIARKMLQMDPKARSSMWEDFQSGRKTEIAEFQGAISKLANMAGVDAPMTDKIIKLVQQVEDAESKSPNMTAREIQGN